MKYGAPNQAANSCAVAKNETDCCKAQQLLSPGFLAGLVEAHRLANERGAKTPNVL